MVTKYHWIIKVDETNFNSVTLLCLKSNWQKGFWKVYSKLVILIFSLGSNHIFLVFSPIKLFGNTCIFTSFFLLWLWQSFLQLVFCFQNCSDLLWEKIVLVIEITSKNYSNIERSVQFMKQNAFLTFFLEVSQIQYIRTIKKKIGI